MADPVGVAGCLSWHDASDASTLYDATSGGSLVVADAAVARFEDKSGNGYHLINATSAQRPLRKTSIQHSHDCLLFDGTDDRLRSSSNFPETGNAEFSTFVVSKKLTATKGTLFGWGQSSSLNGSGLYDDNSFVLYGYGGGNSYIISTIPTTDFYLHSYLKSAGAINTSSTARRNRSNTATSGHQTTTPNIAADKLSLGIWSNFTSVFYHGYVAEMVIYDSKLSDADRDLVESYLYTKWIAPPATSRRRMTQASIRSTY